jgi:AraC-like DNA-binding protein
MIEARMTRAATVAATYAYRSIHIGVETLPARSSQPRHRHLEGYANVVLAGSFIETGFAGVMHAAPGDVLLHGWYDCHADVQCSRRCIQVLRLPWNDASLEGHFRISDPDELARLVESDPNQAVGALSRQAVRVDPPPSDWTHELARALCEGSPFELRAWAESRGYRPDALSRGFRRHFGVSPKLYRLEARTRRAWLQVTHTNDSLTRIAADHGFADLAHMSRSMRVFTGRWPSEWRRYRREAKSVQAR